MGVSAIFVSTLAVTELPAPRSPPQSQAELLAATLQTIVGFVVLCSIVVRTCLPHALCRRRDADWPVQMGCLSRSSATGAISARGL